MEKVGEARSSTTRWLIVIWDNFSSQLQKKVSAPSNLATHRSSSRKIWQRNFLPRKSSAMNSRYIHRFVLSWTTSTKKLHTLTCRWTFKLLRFSGRSGNNFARFLTAKPIRTRKSRKPSDRRKQFGRSHELVRPILSPWLFHVTG